MNERLSPEIHIGNDGTKHIMRDVETTHGTYHIQQWEKDGVGERMTCDDHGNYKYTTYDNNSKENGNKK